jgi:hypothetical protein
MAPENDKQSGKSAIAGGAGGHRVAMTGHAGGHLFQPGNPGGPGRPRGSSNRLEADIINAAVRAGFIKLDENGNRVGSDRDGCEAYLAWAARYDPKTFLAYMARNLPRYAKSPGKGIRSREKALAQLRERGLPEDLIDHLRKAPEMWDPDPTA